MYWATLSDFLHMGGYAFYVWMSFGFTALVLALELIWLRRNKANAAEELKDMQS